MTNDRDRATKKAELVRSKVRSFKSETERIAHGFPIYQVHKYRENPTGKSRKAHNYSCHRKEIGWRSSARNSPRSPSKAMRRKYSRSARHSTMDKRSNSREQSKETG
ncbi:MAG TPA: hypothetical protein DGH68_11405 [Bacteroidetes bacterium]|nr:hypothetical protein [Bacteroidota bacterium]